jgi:phage shock protein B
MRGLIRLVLVGLVLVVCLSLVLGSMALVSVLFAVGTGLLRVPQIGLLEWRFSSPGTFVALGPVLLLTIFVCLALAVLWKLRRGETSRNHQRLDAEESRTMQELYRGLSRLEERVESLETILLDRASRSRVRRKAGLGIGDRKTGEG